MKGNIKCTIYLTDESSFPPSNSIACATYNDGDNAIFNQFVLIFKDLNSSGELYWVVEQVDGVFASGWYSYGRAGNIWIAKKIDRRWQRIFDINDPPLCSKLKEYGVERNFYRKISGINDDCYNENNQTIKY